MHNTEISLNNEELENINIEAFKNLYKAQREKNTMIIKLYAFSCEPELSKSILSICKNYINEMKRDFVNQCNNPEKLFPTVHLDIKEYIYEERHILYIYVYKMMQTVQASKKGVG